MKYSWGLFVFASLLYTTTVHAAGTSASYVSAANLTQEGKTLNFSFSLQNTGDTSETLRYGIRLQSIDGTSIYEAPLAEVLSPAQESIIEYGSLTIPSTLPSGEYRVYLLSRDVRGLVDILKYFGVVTLTQPKNATPTISACEVAVWPTVHCSVAHSVGSSTMDIGYQVNEGSAYGATVAEGILKDVAVQDGQLIADIPTAVTSGVYTISVWVGARENFVTTFVDLGTPQTSVQDAVATSGDTLFVPTSFLSSAQYTLIGALLMVLMVLLWLALRRAPPGGGTLIFLGALFVIPTVSLGAMTLTDTNATAHIFDALSKDGQNIQYQISQTKASWNMGESVEVTYVFQATQVPNAKPVGSIFYNKDGGAWNLLAATTSSLTFDTKTLGSFATSGVHTLNFTSPSLCGSAFGFSFFNIATFGATDCVFSMPVTVANPQPPSTPVISGNCVVGAPCTIGIVSSDPDGGTLTYQAESPTGTFVNAGSAVAGNPVSIIRTFNSCAVSAITVKAQATDSTSRISAWGTGTPTCTTPCPVCTYDGNAPIYTITATPLFIPRGGATVTVQWSLGNVKNCSITGVDTTSGQSLDSWSWVSVVSQMTSHTTSAPVTKPARYTLSCSKMDGTALPPKSVTISTAPQWQEF